VLKLQENCTWGILDNHSFGGDAKNVTVMGQSAGAVNLLALMTSPKSKDLFHKAIPLSGGISLTSNLPPGRQGALSPAPIYLQQANSLIEKLLLADGLVKDLSNAKSYVSTQTPSQIANYLRSKDAKTILTTMHVNGLGGSGPILDDVIVPVDPIAAISNGKYMKVPTIVGITRDEGKLFSSLLTIFGGKPGMKIDTRELINKMYNFNSETNPNLTTADILDNSYLPVNKPNTGYDALTKLITDYTFKGNMDNLLNTMKLQQSNIWVYQFDWAQEPYPWNEVYGAAHGIDLPFVFGNFGSSVLSNVINSKANQSGRLELSNAMINSIAAFMRNGDPNSSTLGTIWTPWPAKLNFDASLTEAKISISDQ